MEIWLYVDEFASMGSTPESEYEEMEAQLRELLPDVDIRFVRDMKPTDLSNAMPRAYVWDIGGMCKVDFGGTRRRNWSHTLMTQIDDHPNTLFVPWSQMTGDAVRCCMQEFMPEWDDPEAVLKEPPDRHNVWLPPKACNFTDIWWKHTGLAEKLREFAK